MQDHLKAVTKSARIRRFPKGGMILYQGEAPQAVQVLISGVVKVFSISDAGDEQIVTYHTAYDMFPVSWVFGETTSALFFYQAAVGSEVAQVPKDEFHEYFSQDISRANDVISSLATSYAAFLLRINALQQSKARQKLAYTLYYLSQRYGSKQTKDQLTTIQISFTHQHLAALVGLTRETTAVEMNAMKKEKILSYANQTYAVDVSKLLDIIGEDNLRNVQLSV